MKKEIDQWEVFNLFSHYFQKYNQSLTVPQFLKRLIKRREARYLISVGEVTFPHNFVLFKFHISYLNKGERRDGKSEK